MKQIEKNELIEGRIYSSKSSWRDSTELFIWKCDKNGKLFYSYRLWSKDKVSGAFGLNSVHSWDNIFEATPEEKHWLETCIKADKFVEYDEAMKSFIPEFVLPEIWWVRITKENLKDICKFLNFNLGENTIGLIAGMVKSYKTGTITKSYNSTPTTSYGSTFGNEITFDQFKQYVFKENTKVTEKPKVIFEEPKYDILVSKEGKYIGVQCPEGGVYKIGDKIKVFTHNSPNKGKSFTIKSFRWTNDKSKIYAVTELHTPNGIGLDKIELYVEPKVKFVLPEKWCVKVNQEIRNRLNYIDIIGYHHSIQINDTNKWSNKIREGFTEITFEQFKKYVLNEKV